jgi:class 3 adenylate cyclase
VGLQDQLAVEVDALVRGSPNWPTRAGQQVPEPKDLGLTTNDVVTLSAAVLYADIVDSTGLVDGYRRLYAASLYRAFLLCAARIVRSEGGTITAYDGDRIMSVFLDPAKEDAATRAALKIKTAVVNVVNPLHKMAWTTNPQYVLRHRVGIDVSDLYVVRTGVRNDNDLAWIGPAANHAAKLASITEAGFSTYISAATYTALSERQRTDVNGYPVWEARTYKGRPIYRSDRNWTVI